MPKKANKIAASSANSSANSSVVNSEIAAVTLQGKLVDMGTFTPCSRVDMADFPALPCLFDRLRRLNHAADTIAAKKAAIEAAIEEVPVNLKAMVDEKRIQDFINHNALIGVQIDRQSAMQALQIVRNETPVKLINNTPKRRVSVERSSESLELKPNDIEILALYKKYGFMTHTDFVQKIQENGTAVTSAVLSRYSNITKQIAFLQGKESNNGYLKDIQTIGCTPLEMLLQLSAHEKYHLDTSTFALTKRAVRIYAALTE